MTHPLDDARQDLEFLRRLADDAGPTLRPLGALLALTGTIQALSAVRIGAVEAGWIGWPDVLRPTIGIDGLGLQLLAMWALTVLAPSLDLPRRSTNPGARAVRGAVNALAWALGSAALALFVAGLRGAGSEPMSTAFAIMVFALAGATWQVLFAVYRHAWALAAAIASALTAVTMGLVAPGAERALAMGAGLLLCVALPGAALLRQARSV